MKLQKLFSNKAKLHILDFIDVRVKRAKQKLQPPTTPNRFFSNDELKKFDAEGKLVWTFSSGLKMNLYADSLLSKAIIEGFEIDELAFVQRFLRSEDTFIDIGANVGLFSLTASPLLSTGQIFAIEPSPTTFKRFEQNIKLNQFTNIKPLPMALSKAPGEMDFFTSLDGFDAWNGFSVPIKGEIFKRIKVRVNTLDNLYRQEPAIQKTTLVKIDVEGWEFFVLQGAAQFIEEVKPVFFIEFTEINAEAAGFTCNQVYDFFTAKGYQWFTYDAQNNQVIPAPRLEKYDYLNLIAASSADVLTARLQ